MGKIINSISNFILVIFLSFFILCCKQQNNSKKTADNWETEFKLNKEINSQPLTQEFKDYWYAGEAEITSYKLEQARYGEIRQGTAVLVYVTEDFLPNIQVKADNNNDTNISVLKLNTIKKFNTGIYPYSIMQSTFYPVSNNSNALKVSCSIQEWCGHFYAQINNRKSFEVISHSYFEGEADQNFNLSKTIMENELWTQLRIDPKSLPVGELEIIPSLEYTRLRHKPIKTYKASAILNSNSYTISYPELERTLTISFNPEFPYNILNWEETFKSGFGENAKILTTKAIKLESIKSAYWTKNNNTNEILRDSLQLN